MKEIREAEMVSDDEELVDGGSHSGNIIEENDSDRTLEDDSDSDDAPEAESLSGGRAAADAREGALKRHEDKLREVRKSKNKAREEFIRSSKTQNLPVTEDKERDAAPADDDGESEDSEKEEEYKVTEEIPKPGRLPDSVFAVAHQLAERKRAEKPLKKDAPAKRRRVCETPAERIVDGRTLRVAADFNAPPVISSSSSTRKAKNSAKGGSSFRRKWKKVDATRAQVRSRTGPSRNFVTVVQ